MYYLTIVLHLSYDCIAFLINLYQLSRLLILISKVQNIIEKLSLWLLQIDILGYEYK